MIKNKTDRIPPLVRVDSNARVNLDEGGEMPPLARIRMPAYPFKNDHIRDRSDSLLRDVSQQQSQYIGEYLPPQIHAAKKYHSMGPMMRGDSRSQRVSLNGHQELMGENRFDSYSQANQFLQISQEWHNENLTKNQQHLRQSSRFKNKMQHPIFINPRPETGREEQQEQQEEEKSVKQMNKFNTMTNEFYQAIVLSSEREKGIHEQNAELIVKGILTKDKKMRQYLQYLGQLQNKIIKKSHQEKIEQIGMRDDFRNDSRMEIPELKMKGKQKKDSQKINKNLQILSTLLVKLSDKTANVHIKHVPVSQGNITSRTDHNRSPSKTSLMQQQDGEEENVATVSKITNITFGEKQQSNTNNRKNVQVRKLKERLEKKDWELEQIKIQYDNVVNNLVQSISNLKNKAKKGKEGQQPKDLFSHLIQNTIEGCASVQEQENRESNAITFMKKTESALVDENEEIDLASKQEIEKGVNVDQKIERRSMPESPLSPSKR